ncbi:MAG TPA: cytochrome c [Bacteroidia bacterium]|jgi:hypothetical protein|nr:cytochrome c [Bacteroidia bacterium]
MKIKIITILSVLALFISSCHSKKSTTASTPDILMPGDAQLKAIQVKFADATAQTLKDGYDIYIGPCTNCHGKKNMFRDSEAEWQHNIDKMAPKAKITDAQKDALWKYVLSMRLVKGTPAN